MAISGLQNDLFVGDLPSYNYFFIELHGLVLWVYGVKRPHMLQLLHSNITCFLQGTAFSYL